MTVAPIGAPDRPQDSLLAAPSFEIEGGTLQLNAVELLGQGSQGTVFRADKQGWILKRCAATGRDGLDAVEQRLQRVEVLGMEDLPIALPEALARTEDAVWYAARLLDEMEPLTRLLRPPLACDDVVRWLSTTGGLRRRLRLLARLGWLLAALHRRGLCFGDVSPMNVFVSCGLDHEQVWLIDADNIDLAGRVDRGLYTPRFGAPELVRGEATASLATDAWSFATLAFETLTLAHPLLGDEVHDGDPELEERALRGERPWIDDLDDDSNRTERGLPRELVLSSRLRKLAEATFGLGRSQPQERPSVAAWAEALEAAAAVSIPCDEPDCGHTFSAALTQCPFCDKRRRDDLIRVELDLWRTGAIRAPGGAADDLGEGPCDCRLGTWAFARGETLHLPKSRLLDEAGWYTSPPHLHLHLRADGKVDVSVDASWAVSVAPPEPGAKRHRVAAKRTVDRGWLVFLEEAFQVADGGLQRVLRLWW